MNPLFLTRCRILMARRVCALCARIIYVTVILNEMANRLQEDLSSVLNWILLALVE